jgi:hypothetical protein
LVGTLDLTLTPGALMFGLMIWPKDDGPREEKLAMLLFMSVAPLEYDSA